MADELKRTPQEQAEFEAMAEHFIAGFERTQPIAATVLTNTQDTGGSLVFFAAGVKPPRV